MQVQTELRPMFHYSFIPILIFIVLIIIVIILKIVLRKKPVEQIVNIPKKKDLIEIKRRYLSRLNNLKINFDEKRITNRQAFQSLSLLIRQFIFEATNIKVQNYTLKEIRTLNLPSLTELVAEFYDPEFSKISAGNIESSLEKTRKVIEKWV